MMASAVVQRGVRLLWRAAAAVAFLPPLLTRLFVGHVFYQTGSGKLAHPEGVVRFFTELGIPLPALNAAFVSHLEFYGAIALIVGLATRPVALALATTMVVALATADKEAFLDALFGRGEGDLTSVAPLVLLVCLTWLVVNGAGWLSLDGLVVRALGLRREESRPSVPPT
jgi:putative oxidoreductase